MTRTQQTTETKGETMTKFERLMLIEDCREACRTDEQRTEQEARDIWERGRLACKKLRIDNPDDYRELV